MGDLVGGSSAYSTWGAFRTPLGVRNENIPSGSFNFSTRTVGQHSISYDYGFKLQDNGLVTSIVNFYSPAELINIYVTHNTENAFIERLLKNKKV